MSQLPNVQRRRQRAELPKTIGRNPHQHLKQSPPRQTPGIMIIATPTNDLHTTATILIRHANDHVQLRVIHLKLHANHPQVPDLHAVMTKIYLRRMTGARAQVHYSWLLAMTIRKSSNYYDKRSKNFCGLTSSSSTARRKRRKPCAWCYTQRA